MKTIKAKLNFLTLFCLFTVIFLSGFSFVVYSNYYTEVVELNPEYTIKRIPDGTVTLYSNNKEGKRQEYVFKDFNADIILSLYRKIDVKQMTLVLARKYYLSEAESRRDVKRAITVLENWGIVIRKFM